LCCAVLCCVVLCCASLGWVVLCCAVLCCAEVYCALMCCSVLRCAVLCCAVLCCVVLCSAVLCWVGLGGVLCSSFLVVMLPAITGSDLASYRGARGLSCCIPLTNHLETDERRLGRGGGREKHREGRR